MLPEWTSPGLPGFEPSRHPRDTFAAGRARVLEAPGVPLTDQLSQRLLAERIVFIGSEIDDDLANRVCSQLLLLAAEDGQRDISIYINSPGGSTAAGFAIYDMMRYLPNSIATVGIGMAASMGQFLLTAGTPGKRSALRHTRIMMHQPSGGIGGTASDIRIQAEQSLYMKRRFFELLALHTGRPLEVIEHDADRDRYFTAEEARDYGIVDNVVVSANEVGGVRR